MEIDAGNSLHVKGGQMTTGQDHFPDGDGAVLRRAVRLAHLGRDIERVFVTLIRLDKAAGQHMRVNLAPWLHRFAPSCG